MYLLIDCHYRCGNTSITVPCGREKKTKPPKCNLPCKIPSKCHHTNFHKCHINECPSCVQLCMLENDTTKCGHTCNVKCHDAVKVQIIDKNYKPSTPWEVQPDKFELQKMPHPPCEVPVEVECIGGHEKSIWPCWNSKSSSCGRICGRKLKCGNHVCELICHAVEDKASIEVLKSKNQCSVLIYTNSHIFSSREINPVRNVLTAAVYLGLKDVCTHVSADVIYRLVMHVTF